MAKTPLTWNGKDAQGNALLWNSPNLVWGGDLPQSTHRMPQLRVLLDFASASDHSLEESAQAVHDSLYGNAIYPSPPVTAVDLEAALASFSAAIAAANMGGPQETADKNNKRETLIGLLRQLAAYVQSKHGNNLADLLSSGFEAVSTNTASSPLITPTITDIDNGISGQQILRVSRIKNAKAYEARYALIAPDGAPGPWVSNRLFTSSRAMPINDLTPGGLYQFQVRAVGGSTGYSDWSDPVSHRTL